MHGDTEEARSPRARARAHWPVVRYRLGEEPSDEVWAGLTPEERVRAMWSITVDAWILAGLSIPAYDRKSTPARLFRPGERVPGEDGDGF
jgi:hypothetical protein